MSSSTEDRDDDSSSSEVEEDDDGVNTRKLGSFWTRFLSIFCPPWSKITKDAYKLEAVAERDSTWLNKVIDPLQDGQMVFGISHIIVMIVMAVLMGQLPSMGMGMALDVTDISVQTPPTNSTGSALHDALQTVANKIGVLPVLILVPFYHAVFGLYGLYFGCTQKMYKAALEKRFNPYKWWVTAVAYSLMGIELSFLLGSRTVDSMLLVIAATFLASGSASRLEALVSKFWSPQDIKALDPKCLVPKKKKKDRSDSERGAADECRKLRKERKEKVYQLAKQMHFWDANNWFLLGSLFLSAYFFLLIGSGYQNLPHWLGGMAIAFVLSYVAATVWYYHTNLKCSSKPTCRDVYFLTNETWWLHLNFWLPLLMTIMLGYYIKHYGN